jgi:predicted nucleic acid-binding protein
MSSAILAGEYVADTVALILWLEHRRVGALSGRILSAAEAGHLVVRIPAMVLAEILYLSEKQRIKLTLQDVAAHMQRYAQFQEQPMSHAVIDTASAITDVPELHDRLIAATARLLNAPLITNDPVIQRSAFVTTIW